MNRLSIGRLGLAVGLVCSILYIACAVIMAVVPKEPVIWFFNSLMHGIDVEPVLRRDIPWWETLIGLGETFVIAFISGMLLAAIYNMSGKAKKAPAQPGA